MKRTSWHRGFAGGALVIAGMLTGAALDGSSEALGEVRAGPEPTAFQTGGQLSVPVLKEIAATLHQIDSRLARLETVAQKLQSPRAGVRAATE
jgi:hypothetical protein